MRRSVTSTNTIQFSQKEFYQLYAFFNNFDGAPETVRAPKGGIQEPFVKLSTDASGKAGVTAMVMRDRATPKKTFMLNRGAYDDPGEEVQRNTPAFLPPLKPKGRALHAQGSGRLAGGSSSPADGSSRGESHLATILRRGDGKDVGRLWSSRRVAQSSRTAGRAGTELDGIGLEPEAVGTRNRALRKPINRVPMHRVKSTRTIPKTDSLARGSRYRMDAEVIRDQILFVSGNLNRSMYGESVKPPQPPGLWKSVSMAAPFTYVADKGDAIYRRSLYTYWRRGMPPPQMTILNAPSREFCTPRRERTNTPLQALLLMNEKEFFKAAQSCAQLTLDEVKHDEDQGLTRLYEKVTSHVPDSQRQQLLKETLQDFREHYAADPKLTESLTPEMAKADMQQRVEIAAWTLLTHSLLNLELAKVKR